MVRFDHEQIKYILISVEGTCFCGTFLLFHGISLFEHKYNLQSKFLVLVRHNIYIVPLIHQFGFFFVFSSLLTLLFLLIRPLLSQIKLFFLSLTSSSLFLLSFRLHLVSFLFVYLSFSPCLDPTSLVSICFTMWLDKSKRPNPTFSPS